MKRLTAEITIDRKYPIVNNPAYDPQAVPASGTLGSEVDVKNIAFIDELDASEEIVMTAGETGYVPNGFRFEKSEFGKDGFTKFLDPIRGLFYPTVFSYTWIPGVGYQQSSPSGQSYLKNIPYTRLTESVVNIGSQYSVGGGLGAGWQSAVRRKSDGKWILVDDDKASSNFRAGIAADNWPAGVNYMEYYHGIHFIAGPISSGSPKVTISAANKTAWGLNDEIIDAVGLIATASTAPHNYADVSGAKVGFVINVTPVQNI